MGERTGGVDTVKQVLPIHGPDHGPGGPDPIPTVSAGLKWAHVLASAVSITPSSGDYQFTFTNLYASDSDTFELADVTASRAAYLQVNTPGVYTVQYTAGGTSVWDNTYYTKLTPMMELSGSPADLIPNLDTFGPDFSLNQFNPDSEMFDGETAHKNLWDEVSFNWDPDNPVSDLDDENPLKLSMRVETVEATAAKLLQAEMYIVRIGDPGYVDLSI